MAFGTGVATISFPVSARAAETINKQVISDTNPGNICKIEQFTSASADIASNGTDTVVVLASTGTSLLVTKDNGLSWSTVDVSAFTGGASRVVYGNGVFLLTGQTSAQVMRSSDGLSWATVGSFTASGNWSAIDYGGDRWVAHSSGTTVINYSTNNGTSWTAAALASAYTSDKERLRYGNGLFVLFTSNQLSKRSADGITWTDNQTALNSNNVRGMIFCNGYHWSICGNAFNTLNRSSNGGQTWELISPVTYYGRAIVNGGYINGNNNFLISGTTFNNSTSRLQITYDFGTSWYEVFTNYTGTYTFGPFALIGNKIYAIANNVTNAIFSFTVNNRSTSSNTITVKPAITNMGTNSITYTVTGLASITADASVEVFMMASDSTSSHNTLEHELADITLSVENIVPGTGFDIVATSKQRLDGDFKVRYVWST